MRSVLIVDDDPFIRKLVSTTLEDVAGFQLHEAANGVEAVERAAAVHPELGAAQATIVMLTAAGAEENETRARAAGADLFLTKPFSPLDLLRLVDELA
jgi:CheY-like chemotaxis protein